MKKDSRLLPIENLANSNFLTSSFSITNIIIETSLNRDLKVKKEFIVHPNQIHYNRYINFIYSRRFRETPENSYTEKHHIIPKSLGGFDEQSNLIILTGREHFIAHMMLWKTFGGKMACSFWFMSNNKREHSGKLTSKQYVNLKKDRKLSEEMKIKLSILYKGKTYEEIYGEDRAKEIKEKQKNKVCSQETKKKISKANKGRKKSKETRKKLSETNKGKPNPFKGVPKTEEHKKNLSKAAKNRPPRSLQHRKKLSESKKGKKRSEETKKKISKTSKGKKRSEETKKKMSDSKRGKLSPGKNTKWINNGEINKRTPVERIEIYLDEGWKLGRIFPS